MYKVYNRNPEGDRLPDCVTRAISLGTGADYRDVQKMLHINGDEKDCDDLCVECYSHMLDEIGYPKLDGNKKQSPICAMNTKMIRCWSELKGI